MGAVSFPAFFRAIFLILKKYGLISGNGKIYY